MGIRHVGELGNGSAVPDSNVPVAVTGLTSVKAISAGGFPGLALLSGGTVRAWGYNHDGELGNGTNTDSNVPVTVSGLTGVKDTGGRRPRPGPAPHRDGHGLGLQRRGRARQWHQHQL